MIRRPRAVLFDLDGTLIDSAPDLAGACNDMREAHGLAPLSFDALRPMVGAGARGMVEAGFSVAPEDPRFLELREEFLSRYEARHDASDPGVRRHSALLDSLDTTNGVGHRDQQGGPPRRTARRMALLRRDRGALICGDTTPHSKPHPAPLLEAARRSASIRGLRLCRR